MEKPIIGIVGRENLSNIDGRSIMSTDDGYRRAVIKARRNSAYDTSNTRF